MKVTTKSFFINVPYLRWGPLFTWAVIASNGNNILSGWCESKNDLEILRKRVVRKLRKLSK
jgi:hypothetical protein